MTTLEVENLAAGYYDDLLVIRDFSLTAKPGMIAAVLGANGVGKSTLLKVIFGFLPAQSGRITLDGESIVHRPSHKMVELGVSYLSQLPSLFREMTVEQNLRLGAWSLRGERREIEHRLQASYERFPALREKRRQVASELSGGQQRMVEIARALMTKPRLLLVDEPTAGLSVQLANEVYAELAKLRDEGLTIVLVDQEIRKALKIADYVYVIELGTNRFEGTPEKFADIEKHFWV